MASKISAFTFRQPDSSGATSHSAASRQRQAQHADCRSGGWLGMLSAVRISGTADRRQFVTSVAAGFATQLALAPGDAAAQTLGANSTSSTRPLPPDIGLFKGFQPRWVRTNGADIFLRHGGEGPPLLLLHGNPQTHA